MKNDRNLVNPHRSTSHHTTSYHTTPHPITTTSQHTMQTTPHPGGQAIPGARCGLMSTYIYIYIYIYISTQALRTKS